MPSMKLYTAPNGIVISLTDNRTYTVDVPSVGLVENYVSKEDAFNLAASLPNPLTLETLMPLALQWRRASVVLHSMTVEGKLVTLADVRNALLTQNHRLNDLFVLVKSLLLPFRRNVGKIPHEVTKILRGEKF